MKMEFAAHVGWDWADKEHELSVSSGGRPARKEIVGGSANAIHEWAAAQLKRYDGAPIAVCIESSRGTAVHALMCYPHIVLHPVNPKSASLLREALFPSQKKDDPVDADVLRQFVEKHRDRLHPLNPGDAATRKLGLLSEHRKKIVNGITQVTNRLRSNLKDYYPQALELIGDLDTQLACDFLEQWPTLQQLKRARPTTIETFFRRHNSRSAERIAERLAIISSARVLTDDRALVEGGSIKTACDVLELRGKLAARAQIDKAIGDEYPEHPDYALINSFPGVGPVIGPRLIGLLGLDRDRFTSAKQLQQFTGIAPITRQSGGRKGAKSVHRRLARPKFPHQTIVEWAGLSIPHSPWAMAYYEQLIARGLRHYAALRALGYKWLRILFQCWATATPYSEQRHIAELARRGSPVAAAIKAKLT
jgi:transposase